MKPQLNELQTIWHVELRTAATAVSMKVSRQVRTLESVREYFMASVGRSYLYIAHMKVA